MKAAHRLRWVLRYLTWPFFFLSTGGPILSAVLLGAASGVDSPRIFTLGVILLIPAFANAFLTGPRRLSSFSLLSGLKELYKEGTDASEAIKTHVAGARRSVKILDTYFGQFDQMQSSLRQAMSTGAEVRILVAKKGGKLSSSRGIFDRTTINSSVDNLERRVSDFAAQLRRAQIEPSIRIRYFDVAMSGPLYIVDESLVFVGTFLQNLGSQNTPMFELAVRRAWFSKHCVAQAFVESFDLIWESAEEDE